MTTARISEYRSKLSSYHRDVLENHEPLRITGAARGDIIVIPAEDYERILESVNILKDRATMNSLLQGGSDMLNDAAGEALDAGDIFSDALDS